MNAGLMNVGQRGIGVFSRLLVTEQSALGPASTANYQSFHIDDFVPCKWS